MTVLTFYSNGTFHCDGLAGPRPIRIGGGLLPGELGCAACPRFDKCGMSHTSELASSIKDLAAIKLACKELGLAEPNIETVRLYDGQTYTGVAVRLQGWRQPVVIDTKTGTLHYDNYKGHWGDERELNRLKQSYGVAKSMLIAKKNGYTYSKTTMPSGEVRLRINTP